MLSPSRTDSNRTIDVTPHFRITKSKRIYTTNEHMGFMQRLNQRVKTLQVRPMRRLSTQTTAMGTTYHHFPKPDSPPRLKMPSLQQADNRRTPSWYQKQILLNSLLTRYAKMFDPKNCSLSANEKIIQRRLSRQGKDHPDHLFKTIAEGFDDSAFYQTVFDREERELCQKQRILNSIEREHRKRIKTIFTKKRLSKLKDQVPPELIHRTPNQ